MTWPPTVIPVTARELVRRLIVSGVPEFGGRVFENDLPPAGTTTPYAVVRMGNDSVITSWGAKATPVTVWPMIGMTDDAVTYRLLDLLISKIVAALTPNGESALIDEAAALTMTVQQTPGILGNRYFVTYTGVSTQDTRDEALQTITRPVEFSIATLVWRNEEAQPFIAAMATATKSALPQTQIDPRLAMPTDIAPFVYWRWSQTPTPVEQLTLDAWWEEGTVIGHVLTPDPNTRVDAVGKVANAFSPNIADGWHLLRSANGWPFQVLVDRADATADAMSQGQLTVRCRTVNADGDPSQWYGDPDKFTAPLLTTPVVFGPDGPQVGPGSPPPNDELYYKRIRHVEVESPVEAHVDTP